MKLRAYHGIVGATLLVGCVGFVTMAFAEGDAIKDRRAHMKSVGAAAGVLGGMLEGKAPYDAAKAAEALGTMNKVGTTFVADFDKLFPKGSDQGDTSSAPAIWVKTDDFKARLTAFAADAAAGVEATKKDEAAFKAAAGKVFSNCQGCHEGFRIKKG